MNWRKWEEQQDQIHEEYMLKRYGAYCENCDEFGILDEDGLCQSCAEKKEEEMEIEL